MVNFPSKYRSLQPCEKSRVYKISRGLVKAPQVIGMWKRDYWNPSPPVLSSIPQATVTILSYAGSICPQIAVYRAARDFLCFTYYVTISNTQTLHRNWQIISEWPAQLRDGLQTTGHRQRSRATYVTHCDKQKVRETAFQPRGSHRIFFLLLQS